MQPLAGGSAVTNEHVRNQGNVTHTTGRDTTNTPTADKLCFMYDKIAQRTAQTADLLLASYLPAVMACNCLTFESHGVVPPGEILF